MAAKRCWYADIERNFSWKPINQLGGTERIREPQKAPDVQEFQELQKNVDKLVDRIQTEWVLKRRWLMMFQ